MQVATGALPWRCAHESARPYRARAAYRRDRMRSPEGIEGPGCPVWPALRPVGGPGTVEAEVIKSRAAKGKARVTFTVDPRAGARTAVVCGEWNDWSADAGVMHRDAGGGFSVTVDLDAGRAYRFRYLLDGQRWDNDWAADAYVRNDFGGDDSVVDLTALAEPVPSAAKKAPVKKAQAGQKAAAPAAKPARKPAKAKAE